MDIVAENMTEEQAQKAAKMLFGYVHGTVIPTLDVKAIGQLDTEEPEPAHPHGEGCGYCNNFMYDGRY